MVEQALVGLVEHRRRRGAGEAIQQHRNTRQAAGQNGAGDGRQFQAANAAHHLKRIGHGRLVDRQTGRNSLDLSGQSGVIDAGAAPHPILGGPAEQRGGQGGAGGGVANPHLAQRHDIEAVFHRHHAVGKGAGAVFIAHRRALREVGGGLVQSHFVDPQVRVDQRRQLIYRSAAVDIVGHHLRGHLHRKGRHALRRHPMVGGKDRDTGTLQARLRLALPGCQPDGDLLQPPQRPGRLGQLGLSRLRGGCRFQVRPGQFLQQGANLIQLRNGFGLTHGLFPS